ncbi:MAG TPA: oligopeptide/dipeptide ABC transporter ATP-binding protein, partial [Acidimicrobiia bacterium]
THDLGVVAEMAHRVAVMYAGEVVEEADVRTIFKDPLHPYTQGLVGSIPVLGARKPVLDVIPGVVPSLVDLPPGCRFADRCVPRLQNGLEQCTTSKPELRETAPGHKVRCWLHDGEGHTDG